MLADGDEDRVVVLREPSPSARSDQDAVEAVALVDRDDDGVAEVALLADHGLRGDRVGREALRLRLAGGRLDALGGDDVHVAADVAGPPRDEHALRRAGQLQRGAEQDLAHAVQIALAALLAVHALDAVAQGGVPTSLGGVEALESLGTGLLAAEVVAEAVPFADEREVAGPRDVAQLALGLRLPGALLLERAHRRVGAPDRPAPADERGRGERQRAEDQDCGVPLAHVDGDPGDEAGHDVRGDRGGGRGRADPARTAGRCRNARLHGAARLDAVRRRRQSWADSFAVGLEIPPPGSQEAPNVPFSPVRTGGRAPFRREER